MFKLGVIGAGAMGSALLRGLLRQQRFAPGSIAVSEPDPSRGQALAAELGIQLLSDNRQVAQAEILLLAIKPQAFAQVLREIGDEVGSGLVVSIMAGVSLAELERAFPGRAVVRTMPNTPALVGAGMTALSPGHWVRPEQLAQVEELFRATGEVVAVTEGQMDAVTALSGSGPGYLALVVEALIDGGVQVGLPRPVATQLAVQTLLGTGLLLHQEGIHPALLKDRVTSPGGTTIAGIGVLEERGVRGALIAAVQAACERSRQLGL